MAQCIFLLIIINKNLSVNPMALLFGMSLCNKAVPLPRAIPVDIISKSHEIYFYIIIFCIIKKFILEEC